MNLRTFFFPKNFQEKRKSMEQGFFGLMLSYFVAGLLFFFGLTGLRLKVVLMYPMLVALLVMTMFGVFYLSYLTRLLAISSRESRNIEDLRTVSLFFQKRVFQLFHLPLILIGIVLFRMNEMTWSTTIIMVALLIQLFIFLTEWKLIVRKLN